MERIILSPTTLPQNPSPLIHTAQALVADHKGILAMDESTPTCNKRFAALGIPQTEEAHRAYREMIVTTPQLGESISGAILFDETIRQHTSSGVPLREVLNQAGILVGIKVDLGAKDLAGHPQEKVTEGLDGLRERLMEYAQMGASFAKWRAVLLIGDDLPSRACLEANAHALARYAALCQEAGLVPIVEPEVLMTGGHTLERCLEVTRGLLRTVFIQLDAQQILLEGMLLKPNMVLAGLSCQAQPSADEVARGTLNCLLETVPAAVPGIAFLSGGQSAELASTRLNAMNACFDLRAPWALSFSFGRALQQPALELWGGKHSNVAAAQAALLHRARCNRAARQGKLSEIMNRDPGTTTDLMSPAIPSLPATESVGLSLDRKSDASSATPGQSAGLRDKDSPSQSPPLKLYLVRHGETAWTLSRRHTGLTDIPLTALGEDEVREWGQLLCSIPFTRVLTSPRQRAQRSCELVGLSEAAEIEEDLVEWDYGDYEGLKSTEIRQSRPDWNVFCDGCPQGESPDQISARADRLISRLRTMSGNVALFSHGQFGSVLAARWISLPVVEARHLPLGTASLSILANDPHHPDVPVIELWNLEPSEASRLAPKSELVAHESLKQRAIQRWENEGGEVLVAQTSNSAAKDAAQPTETPVEGRGLI